MFRFDRVLSRSCLCSLPVRKLSSCRVFAVKPQRREVQLLLSHQFVIWPAFVSPWRLALDVNKRATHEVSRLDQVYLTTLLRAFF